MTVEQILAREREVAAELRALVHLELAQLVALMESEGYGPSKAHSIHEFARHRVITREAIDMMESAA